MWELYFITRIGVIHYLSNTLFAIAIVLAIVCYLALIIIYGDYSEDTWQKSKLRKFINSMVVVFSISGIIYTITPTTGEAYLIYGVGSTIDYIQDNPKAKQLPDKCIDALSRWVDNLNKEENKDEK